jgi:hypothetical protein
VDVLLGFFHDSFNVRVGLVNELPQAPSIFEDDLIVFGSNRRVDVAKKQDGNALLVGAGHRHCVYRC